MGQPVVHFEVVGKDAKKLRTFYSAMFGWAFDTNNPMNYGVVNREDNLSPEGIGIGGGVGSGPGDDYPGHVTFYVAVQDVGAALEKVETIGGSRVMGPDEVMEGLVIGLFRDPEGHIIGLVQPDPSMAVRSGGEGKR
jgi:predicted enzyme related to lactoylglutathione lyase